MGQNVTNAHSNSLFFLFIFYYCETSKKAPGFDILLSKHTSQANVGSQMQG